MKSSSHKLSLSSSGGKKKRDKVKKRSQSLANIANSNRPLRSSDVGLLNDTKDADTVTTARVDTQDTATTATVDTQNSNSRTIRRRPIASEIDPKTSIGSDIEAQVAKIKDDFNSKTNSEKKPNTKETQQSSTQRKGRNILKALKNQRTEGRLEWGTFLSQLFPSETHQRYVRKKNQEKIFRDIAYLYTDFYFEQLEQATDGKFYRPRRGTDAFKSIWDQARNLTAAQLQQMLTEDTKGRLLDYLREEYINQENSSDSIAKSQVLEISARKNLSDFANDIETIRKEFREAEQVLEPEQQKLEQEQKKLKEEQKKLEQEQKKLKEEQKGNKDTNAQTSVQRRVNQIQQRVDQHVKAITNLQGRVGRIKLRVSRLRKVIEKFDKARKNDLGKKI